MDAILWNAKIAGTRDSSWSTKKMSGMGSPVPLILKYASLFYFKENFKKLRFVSRTTNNIPRHPPIPREPALVDVQVAAVRLHAQSSKSI